jgi:hypothetical protein
MLSSFVVQLVLYMVVMIAGNLHITVDDVRNTGMHARTLVAVYQVLVICVLILTHSVFIYFIRVVKSDKQSFVLVTRPLELGASAPPSPPRANIGLNLQAHHLARQESASEQELWEDKRWKEITLEQGAALEREQNFHRASLIDASLQGANWQDPSKESARCVDDDRSSRQQRPAAAAASRASSTRAHAEGQAGGSQYISENASVTVTEASFDVMPLSIVFESNLNLDMYFIYVSFIGLVLWDTFVSFNFATHDSNFVLVSGLVCGWICNTLSKECNCHSSRQPAPTQQKLAFLFYTSMFTFVIGLGAANWSVPEDLTAALRINLYVPAFFSGLFWTGIGVDVAFTGVVDVNATKGILYDTSRSIPTFLLVMCVSALYSSPETRESVMTYTSSLSRLALLHLLLIEPVLIFLSMYVMVIALEKQRSTDFTVAMVLVQGVRVVYRSEQYDAVAIAAIAASVLLISVHVSRLMRA